MTEPSATIPCPLRAAALSTPDAPAIVGPGGVLTYADLDLRVSMAAGRLAEIGMREGLRVALYLPKDESYFVLLLALQRSACVACPVSTRFPPDGAAPLLRGAGCEALISDDKKLFDAFDLPLRKLRPEIVLGGDPEQTAARNPETLSLDRPATIVFTSGSTSTPKAALHTLGNHYFSALGSRMNIPLVPGDRWLHSLPIYHVGGLSILFRCLLSGATVVLPEPGAPLGESIMQSGATHVSLVATQLRRLLEKNAALGTLKALLLGGGPVPEALVDAAISRGLPVHTSYGLTEMASQVTTTPPGATPDELRTSGRVLPHREVSISGDGEILVRGETLFAGYVENDKLKRPLDADGWFHTKDLGELDANGYLAVRGRMDNLFVSGGENVRPEEIEDALSRVEGVEEAVVVPIPDVEFGARPVAFVRTSGGAVPREDLAETLRPVLPRFKIPVAFYGWPEEAPAGMKPDRVFFRELARLLHEEGGQPT